MTAPNPGALDAALNRGYERREVQGLRVKVRHYEGEALRLEKLLEATRKLHRRERVFHAASWLLAGALVGMCGAAALARWL